MPTATDATMHDLTMTFEMNGKGYRTDPETLTVLRSIVPAAKASGDSSAVEVMMELGIMNHRIVEMPAMLAAVLADTLYLYSADLAPAVDAELARLRDDHKAGCVARFVARFLALGAREATEDEAEGFPVPEHGDHFGLAYPAR
jgi:hypothetical protein